MKSKSITSGIYHKYDILELSCAEKNALTFFLNMGRGLYVVVAFLSIPICIILHNDHSNDTSCYYYLFWSWLALLTLALVKTIPLLIVSSADVLLGLLYKEERTQYIRRAIVLLSAILGFDRFCEKPGQKPNSTRTMPDYLFRSQITEEVKQAIINYFHDKFNYYLSECSKSDTHLLFHNMMKTVKSTGKVFIVEYSYQQESLFFKSLGEPYEMSKDTINRAERRLKSKDAPFRIDGEHNFIMIPTEKKEIEFQINKILNINKIK